MIAMRYFLALILIVSCSRAPVSDSRPDPAVYDHLAVVGTNDFHGFLKTTETKLEGEKVVSGGAEWFAGYVRILEKKFGDRLLLLDGGDIFQGTLESNTFYGASVMEFYNLLPYRAAAVGNHEFDYGPRKKGDPDRLGALKDRMAEAKFPFVQANIFWKKTGKIWQEKNLFPHVLVNAGGYKVGIVGLTTVSTPGKTLPQNVASLEFRDFLQPTLRSITELREKGAQLILIATHEGGEKKGEPLADLLAALPAGSVDAVVAGHFHQEVREFVHGVPVIQSKSKGLYFGRIDLYVNKKTKKVEPTLTKIHGMQPICGSWFRLQADCDMRGIKEKISSGKAKPEDYLPLRKPVYEGEEVRPDQKVVEVLKPYYAKTEILRREVLGQAKSDFQMFSSGESQTAHLFLKASEAAFPEAKVIYQNGGGFRRSFLKGPITYGDLFEVHPFDNYPVALKLKGKQLKDLVRVGVSGANMIPAVKGVRVTYFSDDSPSYQRDINGDGKKENWERNRLQTLVWEKTGKPVGDEEEFWLATNDYLASGGDNTAHVFSSVPPTKKRYLDPTLRDLTAEYLRKNPKLSLPWDEEIRIKKVP